MLSSLKGIFCNARKFCGEEIEMYSSLLKSSKLNNGKIPEPSRSSLHSESNESEDLYEVD